MRSWWRRYWESIPPDRELTRGKYTARLSAGPFHSTITVWKDVWPALGGRIGITKVGNRDAEAKWNEVVAALSADGRR